MGGPNVKITMVDKMLTFIAPHLCSGCGEIGTLLCDHCKYDIIKTSFDACMVCKSPTSVGICIEHNKSLKNAWIVGERRGTLQRLIGGYKFQNMKAAAKDLAGLLDTCLPALAKDVVFVPIPTAPAHIRERGYDHTLLLTKYLAHMRNLPIERVIARRNVETQHHANRADRIKQAVTAFRLQGSIDPAKHYIIVDDVITTGATIDFASQLLADAGATNISVAALALQPLD